VLAKQVLVNACVLMLAHIRCSPWSVATGSRCNIPAYARVNNETGELDPGICRTFLDQKHIPGGDEWEQVFCKAVINTLVIVPLLSWYEHDDGGEPSGSVGQLMALHKGDKVDNFLLEIVIANALIEVPAANRWLQRIEPIFIGPQDSRGFQDFPFANICRLPAVPSMATCRKAADILISLGYPVDCKVMAFSVQEHIQRVMEFQGIKLSILGSDENALETSSKKLVEAVPALERKLGKFIRDVNKKALYDSIKVDLQAKSDAVKENEDLKRQVTQLEAKVSALEKAQNAVLTPRKSSLCSIQ
jgi:hypothetical protein